MRANVLCRARFRDRDVWRLMAVAKLVDSGHKVVFERKGGYDASRALRIESGERVNFARTNNVYEMDFAV